jgi:hypothetical protein
VPIDNAPIAYYSLSESYRVQPYLRGESMISTKDFHDQVSAISNGDELFEAFERLDDFFGEERAALLSLLVTVRDRLFGQNLSSIH